MAKSLALAWKHIRRSPYQAIASVIVLTVTFLVASAFLLGAVGSHVILSYFETRPQVTAFFQDTATEADISSLKKDLEAQEFVSSVKYVSKEEALTIYREQNKDDPLLLEMVTADILPASLEVSGTSADVLPQIAEIMSGRTGVEEVVYQRDVIEALRSWTSALRLAGLALVAALIITSILILIVTIGMKISIRRSEIEILHLLGASSWYIKNPFVLEGVIYGVTAAIIGWGISYIGLLYATPFLASFLGDIPVLPVPVTLMLALLGVEIVFGVVLGTLASLAAVRRFLRP